MSPDTLVFIVLAAVAVAAGLGLILSRNALYAALFLIVNFGAVAVLYLLLNAPFLAAVQVSVYAGAIMVLFLFVIMLLGAESLGQIEEQPSLRWQRPLAIVLAIVLIGQAAYVLLARDNGGLSATLADTSPIAIGKALINSYLFPFEIVSIVLLAAMIGAVVLTREK